MSRLIWRSPFASIIQGISSGCKLNDYCFPHVVCQWWSELAADWNANRYGGRGGYMYELGNNCQDCAMWLVEKMVGNSDLMPYREARTMIPVGTALTAVLASAFNLGTDLGRLGDWMTR